MSAATATRRKRAPVRKAPDTQGCRRSCPCQRRSGEFGQASNEELAALARSDCLKGWNELYVRMRSSLAAYAFMLRGDSDSADDLIQETLVRAWDNRMSYDPRYPYFPWIRTLMMRISTDWHRRSQSHARMLARKFVAMDPDERIDTIDTDAIAASDDRGQLRARLQMALTALSEKERTVILAWAEGAGPHEIADGMNAKPGTVRGTLFRARQRLTEAFHEAEETGRESTGK